MMTNAAYDDRKWSLQVEGPSMTNDVEGEAFSTPCNNHGSGQWPLGILPFLTPTSLNFFKLLPLPLYLLQGLRDRQDLLEHGAGREVDMEHVVMEDVQR